MGKPLADKLGFKPGTGTRVEGAPEELALGLPTGGERAADLLVFFVRDAAAIGAAAPRADTLYVDGARLWFAYPKKTGAIVTDIDRDRGWEPLAARGFLGVAQVALHTTWSALRFRRRREIAKLTRRSERADGG